MLCVLVNCSSPARPNWIHVLDLFSICVTNEWLLVGKSKYLDRIPALQSMKNLLRVCPLDAPGLNSLRCPAANVHDASSFLMTPILTQSCHDSRNSRGSIPVVVNSPSENQNCSYWHWFLFCRTVLSFLFPFFSVLIRYELLHVLDFDCVRRRMSVIVKDKSG